MFTLKQAQPTDAEAISHIAHTTWWPAYGHFIPAQQLNYMLALMYTPQALSQQIAAAEQTYILVMEGDQAVAFAAYAPRTETPDVYKLHKLYCLPQTQGKGYGRILIEEVCSRARAAGKMALHLNVNRHNQALYFYKKMGFEVLYQEDIPIGDFWMNDYVMGKSL